VKHRSESNKMDTQTVEAIANMVCGDDSTKHPTYRTGSELSRFFGRAGFLKFVHDGSTRKWWTLSVIQQLPEQDLHAVILRLANPREYQGDEEKTRLAVTTLNGALQLDGYAVEFDGVQPKLVVVKPTFSKGKAIKDLQPLPPPDFLALALEAGLGPVMAARWEEIQKCVSAGAYLASTILMGSFLEGMLLAVVRRDVKNATTCVKAPKDKSGKVLVVTNWSLSQMIDVAHEVGWVDLDVKKFSHSLREFRNLIHPYAQVVANTRPDKDTCEISWLVVQAAVNDLSQHLK